MTKKIFEVTRVPNTWKDVRLANGLVGVEFVGIVLENSNEDGGELLAVEKADAILSLYAFRRFETLDYLLAADSSPLTFKAADCAIRKDKEGNDVDGSIETLPGHLDSHRMLVTMRAMQMLREVKACRAA